jgi:hypothetical protein
MTVAEMVTFLARSGYRLRGRASKVVSDCLRWEMARGRVRRQGRGVYCYGTAPKTTARRIALFGRQSLAWITATEQGAAPPPTPATPAHRRISFNPPPEDPARPPWHCLDWLWST